MRGIWCKPTRPRRNVCNCCAPASESLVPRSQDHYLNRIVLQCCTALRRLSSQAMAHGSNRIYLVALFKVELDPHHSLTISLLSPSAGSEKTSYAQLLRWLARFPKALHHSSLAAFTTRRLLCRPHVSYP